MKVKTVVKISPSLSRTLNNLANAPYASVAGLAVYNFLRDYHTQFAQKWRGPKWISSAKSGQFAQSVVDGWQKPQADARYQNTITNTFGLLWWKTTGGTITPKQANMLTIPLTTAARNTTARQFPQPLFRTGNALSIALGKKIQAQYALVKSVTQEPWPGAMPPLEEIAGAALEGMDEHIRDVLK